MWNGFARLIPLVVKVSPKRSRQRLPFSCPTTPVSSPVEPLADDDAVALPPVHLDGILGINGGEVVEGCDQQMLAALCLQKFRQQRVGADRLSAGVERGELQRGHRLVYAVCYALHAIDD